MIHVNRYERVWLTFGFLMLAAFLATITVAAVVDGINPPSAGTTIDPTKVADTAPFDKPGLRQTGPKAYEAYYVARVFSYTPAKISVPVGSHVTFYVTSPDVVHGFSIPLTDVNVMVVPGWVSSVAHTFQTPGTYLLLCNEYCGAGHQNMEGQVEVTP